MTTTAIEHQKTFSRNYARFTRVYLRLIEIELDKHSSGDIKVIPLDDLTPSIYSKVEAADRIINILENLTITLASATPFWYRAYIKARIFFGRLWRKYGR